MAIRGRKPKPAKLKLIAGNPGKREIAGEPGFETGAIALPEWIADPEYAGRRMHFEREWRRVMPGLLAIDLVRPIQAGAAETLCSHYAQAVWSALKGDVKEARLSFEAYRKTCNEFGLTPASAGRVGNNEGAEAKSETADLAGRLGIA